jgi:hypothetical protein
MCELAKNLKLIYDSRKIVYEDVYRVVAIPVTGREGP